MKISKKSASVKLSKIAVLIIIAALGCLFASCTEQVKQVDAEKVEEKIQEKSQEESQEVVQVKEEKPVFEFKDKTFEKMFCNSIGIESDMINEDYLKNIKSITVIGDQVFITNSDYNDLSYYNSRYYYINGTINDSKGSIKSFEDLSMFYNLDSITVMFNEIENLNGIEQLSKLKYLNVACNNITNIEKAKEVKSLKKIILSGNDIRLMDESYIETCKYLMDNECCVMNMNFLKQVISAGETHSLAINTDNKILICGRDTNNKKTRITDWENLVDVAAGRNHSVGLKPDGTVIAQGSNKRYGQCEVDYLENVMNVEAGGASTAALMQNGFAESVGQFHFGQDYYTTEGVFVDIACGDITNAAVTGYGKAAAAGFYANHIIEQWNYVVQIESGFNQYYARTLDGTVYTTTGQELNWNNIIDIAAGEGFIAGLKEDGMVEIIATSESLEQRVSEWNGVIAIYGGRNHIIGLRDNGTVFSAGDNSNYQASTDDWENIMMY